MIEPGHYHTKFEKLQEAVKNLYYAAHWQADRDVDEVQLWTEVRDAAELEPGQTESILGKLNDKPFFGHGIIISEASFVVDDKGQQWWIHPETDEIIKVT